MKTYLGTQEIAHLEKEATNLRDRLLIRTLSHVGCRVSEALALEVKDIDTVQGTVTIKHLKSRLKLSCPQCGARLGRSYVFCPGCGTRVERVIAEEREHRHLRILPVDKETLRMLQDYIRRGGPVTRKGKRLIFDIHRHRAWQIIHDCAEKANLPKLVNPETGRVHGVSPHRLRDAAVHSFLIEREGWWLNH
ncbi:Tyrosine recombinase XerD [subsurface metagenome]